MFLPVWIGGSTEVARGTGNRRELSSKKSTRKQLKSYRANVRKLQSTGLYTGKPDLRKRPSRYVEKVLQRYADVLSGDAAVVNAPSAKVAKQYKRAFKVKGSNIIVPKEKAERVTIDKRGEIHTTRKFKGRRVRKTIMPSGKAAPRAPKKGTRGFWVIPFQQGDKIVKQRFSSYKELEKFMAGYDRYKDWQNYVEFEEIDEEIEE